MPEALKNNFNTEVIKHLGVQLKKHYSAFDADVFVNKASVQLDALELKERSKQITSALHQTLPADFSIASQIILNALDVVSDQESILFENTNKGHRVNDEKGIAGWIMMPVSDYVTEAALLDTETAQAPNFRLGLDVLKECTKRFSAEFAIRPFLRDFPHATLAVLREWARDENVHVRRLVSEGSRPLLPWGIRLHAFIDNPDLIIPLLQLLRDDDSEYVRRSVANSLNDIAKHHPDKVAQLAAKWWQQNNDRRTKLIKHACRTLLKKGHTGALSLFGYPPIELSQLSIALDKETVMVGQTLHITVSMSHQHQKPQRLLIDYAVHHQKANGLMKPKVFKWTSIQLPAGEHRVITKKHSFKPVTTRKYYAGEHKIEILINGQKCGEHIFTLQQ